MVWEFLGLEFLTLIFCRILARLLLIPFEENEEETVETTSQLFGFESAKERTREKTSQLLPFILGMDKHFKNREEVYEDLDFKMIDKIWIQIHKLLDKKARTYYVLNVYDAVKVSCLFCPILFSLINQIPGSHPSFGILTYGYSSHIFTSLLLNLGPHWEQNPGWMEFCERPALST